MHTRKKRYVPPVNASGRQLMSYRACQEFQRILADIDEARQADDPLFTLADFAKLIDVKKSYLTSVLYRGLSPSPEFLQKCDAIPPEAWPAGARPALPWLTRIVNTHYICTGEVCTDTEKKLYETTEQHEIRIGELTALVAAQRERIYEMQDQINEYEQDEIDSGQDRQRLRASLR